MAYSLNGNNAYMDFSIGNLVGVDGGPISVAALVNLGDANNGALAHVINSSGAAGVLFLETFGVMTYGVNTIARNVSSANLSTLGLVGNWVVLGGSKTDVSANPVGHYGLLGSPLTHFTATSSLTDVGGGSAADSTFKVRLGRFLNSTSEYINGAYAVVVIFKRVLTNPEWDSLSTGDYTTWLGLTPDWGVEFTAIGSRSDISGGGGNELSRTGTSPAISLVADPPGFFGGSGITSTDSFTLSDGAFSVATRDVDSFTLSDGAFSIATRDVDSATLNDGTFRVATSVTDAFALAEGAMRVAASDTEVFTFGDGTFRISVRELDAFTLSEAGPKLSMTDSDSALLSEAQRGSVTTSDSFTLDDTAPARIALTATDSFSLASELERIGVLSTDAFALADAVFSGKGTVTSGDTFGIIEHEHVGGIPEEPDPAQSAPITIRLSSPSLVIRFGTPHLVITLSVPQMRIELE